MKAKIVCFKLSKTVNILILIIILQIIFILFQIKELREERNFNQIQESVNEIENKTEVIQNEVNHEIEQNVIKQEVKKEYETMPSEKKGFKIIGKITIPKLNLDTYILSETTTKALKVSVTKLYGPNINEVGNFCIAGHNYRNNKMFGGIKKLEKGDKIILTDTYGDSVTYEVYENYQTDPKDVSSLNQETKGDREVTLITCTAGAIKRVIVKAVEVYD
ncbi:MAG: sortase [Clostridia bacterium]|nr:sortase [Clostridia bacterium]